MPLARVNTDPETKQTSTCSSAMGIKLQPTGSTNNNFYRAEFSLYNIKKLSSYLTLKMLPPLQEQSLHS
jgi:hypothetical protein